LSDTVAAFEALRGGEQMHALVFDVTIRDRAQGEQFLKERIVPGVSQLPGFVAGYWVNIDESRGTSLVVFESEEAAQSAMEGGPRPPEEAVTINSVALGEVVAHA
jgi:hypothetical protein